MNARSTLRGVPLLAGALLAVVAWGGPLAAQDADARWTPWLGCWETVSETPDDALLCVRPAPGGVEVVSLAAGEVVGTEILAADGQRHATERDGCAGWSTAHFSADGRRVFVDAQHRCEGETQRASNGIIAMTSPHEWVEVESVDVGRRAVAWVKRYRAASFEATQEAGFADVVTRARATETARRVASAPLEVADIIEASGEVHPEAVEAWLAQTNDPFEVDAAALLAMADAGVPESVIDVVVAVSYPEHFALEQEADPRDRDRYGDRQVYGPRGWFGSPLWYDSYYGYGYGYRGYGYGYGGYSPWGYGYSPGVVVVTPRPQGGAEHGRVVAGRGYRVGRGGSSAPASAGRSGSGGSSSAPATSSGGSSSSGGRKAKPRGGKPGGGGA